MPPGGVPPGDRAAVRLLSRPDERPTARRRRLETEIRDLDREIAALTAAIVAVEWRQRSWVPMRYACLLPWNHGRCDPKYSLMLLLRMKCLEVLASAMSREGKDGRRRDDGTGVLSRVEPRLERFS